MEIVPSRLTTMRRGAGRALAVLLGVALCSGCSSWTRVRAVDVPRLLSARGEEVRISDGDGGTATISRADVREVQLVTGDGVRLMAPGRALDGQVALPVADDNAADAAERGWRSLPTFHAPVHMRIEGPLLAVSGEEGSARVPLDAIAAVNIKQRDPDKTALLVVSSTVGAAGLVALTVLAASFSGPR